MTTRERKKRVSLKHVRMVFRTFSESLFHFIVRNEREICTDGFDRITAHRQKKERNKYTSKRNDKNHVEGITATAMQEKKRRTTEKNQIFAHYFNYVCVGIFLS